MTVGNWERYSSGKERHSQKNGDSMNKYQTRTQDMLRYEVKKRRGKPRRVK